MLSNIIINFLHYFLLVFADAIKITILIRKLIIVAKTLMLRVLIINEIHNFLLKFINSIYLLLFFLYKSFMINDFLFLILVLNIFNMRFVL